MQSMQVSRTPCPLSVHGVSQRQKTCSVFRPHAPGSSCWRLRNGLVRAITNLVPLLPPKQPLRAWIRGRGMSCTVGSPPCWGSESRRGMLGDQSGTCHLNIRHILENSDPVLECEEHHLRAARSGNVFHSPGFQQRKVPCELARFVTVMGECGQRRSRSAA